MAAVQALIGRIDLWRAAKLMVDRYGSEAEIQAAMRADEHLASGNLDGRMTWLLTMGAIRDLQRGRKPDEPVN